MVDMNNPFHDQRACCKADAARPQTGLATSYLDGKIGRIRDHTGEGRWRVEGDGMRNSLLSLGLVAVSALVAGCGGGNPATPGAGEASVSCPSVDEAKQAIETLVRKRDIEAAGPGYYVADVRNFQFSDVAFSAPTTLEVKSGAMAQGVCPARFSYTYDRIGSNGQASPQSFGDGMTFYFFKDSFGGWSVQWSR